MIFTFVGEGDPPASLADWAFQGHTTRDEFAVTFPGGVPNGAQVWATACWLSPRLQSGPAARSVCANLPGGVAQMDQGLRMARAA